MMHAKTVLVLLALAAPFAAEASPLAAFWTPCSKADPALNDCMAKALEKFIAGIVKGVPALDIPVLEPIQFGSVDYSTNDLKMVTKNSIMAGMFTGSKIVLVEADPDKYTLRVNFKVPEMLNEGDYEMNGKMLMMPVQGTGRFSLKLKDVSLDVKLIGKGETRDGKNYMVLEDVKVSMVPSDVEVKVENLFNGNKELSDNFHKFAHENWKEIFADMQGKLWSSLGEFFKKSFTKMYHEVPYTEGIYVA